MNRETLLRLEKSEELRVRGIESLSLLWEMPFNEVEKMVDEMRRKIEDPNWLKKEFEAAIDAEFNCKEID